MGGNVDIQFVFTYSLLHLKLWRKDKIGGLPIETRQDVLSRFVNVCQIMLRPEVFQALEENCVLDQRGDEVVSEINPLVRYKQNSQVVLVIQPAVYPLPLHYLYNHEGLQSLVGKGFRAALVPSGLHGRVTISLAELEGALAEKSFHCLLHDQLDEFGRQHGVEPSELSITPYEIVSRARLGGAGPQALIFGPDLNRNACLRLVHKIQITALGESVPAGGEWSKIAKPLISSQAHRLDQAHERINELENLVEEIRQEHKHNMAELERRLERLELLQFKEEVVNMLDNSSVQRGCSHSWAWCLFWSVKSTH
eukprot:jgi/Botrbrau1/13438/Bobra.0082s0042.1